MKIAVTGAGHVGATTAQCVVEKQLANEVILGACGFEWPG